MANKKVVVDPVTRIEGHLRMQAVLDENNVIVDAMSTGTMWRGLEVILKGRDPRDAWAFVERVCGVCTGIHALSAVRAVEDALGIQIPKNANIIRNLMNATLYSQDHLTHFYQLHGPSPGISTHCHRRQYDPNSKKGIPPSQPVHLSLS